MQHLAPNFLTEKGCQRINALLTLRKRTTHKFYQYWPTSSSYLKSATSPQLLQNLSEFGPNQTSLCHWIQAPSGLTNSQASFTIVRSTLEFNVLIFGVMTSIWTFTLFIVEYLKLFFFNQISWLFNLFNVRPLLKL